MNSSTLTVHIDSSLLRLTDIHCRHPRGGCGCERGGERTHLTLLQRNGFGYHSRGVAVIGDPTTALLHRAADTYRISHPFEGGDECTVIEVAFEHEEEVFGQRMRKQLSNDAPRRVSGRNQFAHLRLLEVLRSDFHDPLAAEESAARLCESVLSSSEMAATAIGLSTVACVRVQRVREAILAQPSRNDDLSSLGILANCSPFHLTRIFRGATGLTLADYRARLRVALALGRLMQGENDLSALALDLGFSHHSHFSATFRRHVGVTPTVARKSMRSSELMQLSRNLIVRTPPIE